MRVDIRDLYSSLVIDFYLPAGIPCISADGTPFFDAIFEFLNF